MGNAKGKPDMSVTGEDDRLVGKVGRVTVPIPLSGPGEVLLAVRGGTESFAAWSDEPIAKYRPVVVVETRSARSVVVTPFPEAEEIVRL